MRGYEASSLIDATPAQIWPVLADVAAWPDWDSGIITVVGKLALGEKFTVTSAAAPKRAFPVKATEVTEPTRMVIRGGMPLGLFVGNRVFTLTPEGASTRFTMREEYTGVLAGLIFRTIPDLGPSFRQFAEGLKQQVELPL